VGRIFIPGETKGRLPPQDYNEVTHFDTSAQTQEKLDYWCAKRVGEGLMSAYRNRMWGVTVDSEAGVMVITCPSLSTQKGYYIHIRQMNIHDLVRAGVRAAGEILERYGQSRARIVDEQSLEHLARGARDEVIAGADAAPEPISAKS
jgi:hypothetical protein